MRAAVYTRVSTDEQARHGVSMDVQEADCVAHARLMGAIDVVVYRDPGYSASTMERPALKELLAHLADYSVLVVWRADRLTRSLEHLLLIMRLCQRAGVTVDGVRERIQWETADEQFATHLQGALAERERRVTAERVRAGMRKVVSGGRWPGRPPLGYRLVDKALVVHPDEAELVRSIYQMYLDGATLRGIVIALVEAGIQGMRGGIVSTSQVKAILSNKIYVGDLQWLDEVYAGDHEAIIDRAQWDAVQRRLTLRARTGATVRQYERVTDGRKLAGHRRHCRAQTLSPLFRCGYCGSAMLRMSASGHDFYRCAHNNMRPQPDRHENGFIPRNKAEAMIWRHTELLITDGTLREAVRRVEAAGRDAGGRRAEIEARLAEIEEQLRRAVALAHSGMPLDVIAEANRPLVEEREALRLQLETHAPPPELSEWRDLRGKAVLDRLRKQDAETQLEFLFGIYDRVVAYHYHLEFHYVGDVIPPHRRETPRYYAPSRGCDDLGF